MLVQITIPLNKRYRNALIGFLLVGPHGAGRFAGSDEALTGGLAPAYSGARLVRCKGEAGACDVVGLEGRHRRADNIAAIKAWAGLVGMSGGAVRPPLLCLPAGEREELSADLAAVGLRTSPRPGRDRGR
jgi:hypothetical protein